MGLTKGDNEGLKSSQIHKSYVTTRWRHFV